jgi:hypothetical protein
MPEKNPYTVVFVSDSKGIGQAICLTFAGPGVHVGGEMYI